MHAGGQEFDPPRLHHFVGWAWPNKKGSFSPKEEGRVKLMHLRDRMYKSGEFQKFIKNVDRN